MCFANGLWQIFGFPFFANVVVCERQNLLSKDIATAAVSSIVMVVSPLNSLMSDQVSRLYPSGIRASVIDVNKQTRQHQSDDDSEENIEHVIDFQSLRRGLSLPSSFCSSESLISTKYGRELLLSENYQ